MDVNGWIRGVGGKIGALCQKIWVQRVWNRWVDGMEAYLCIGDWVLRRCRFRGRPGAGCWGTLVAMSSRNLATALSVLVGFVTFYSRFGQSEAGCLL